MMAQAGTVPSAGLAAIAGVEASWHAALRRYLAAIAGGNLVWEFLQMPLYTIWRDGTWEEIAFAAVHCTGGDVLIALSALMVSVLLVGSGRWPTEGFWPVAAVTLVLGLAYTGFSEWLNIVHRAAWAYSDLMPVVRVFDFNVGLSPLLQWIAIPAGAFWWARRRRLADNSG